MAVTFTKDANGKVLVEIDGKIHGIDPSASVVPTPGDDNKVAIHYNDKRLIVDYRDVTTPSVIGRNDLIEKLSQDFFFRVNGGIPGSLPFLKYTKNFVDGVPQELDLGSELEVFGVFTKIDGQPRFIADAVQATDKLNVTLYGADYPGQIIYVLYYTV